MTTALIFDFSDWQAKRRKWCHDRLKNEMLNIGMSIETQEDARDTMDGDEWRNRLQRWGKSMAQAGEMVAACGTALSPARFLETDIWAQLPLEERRQYAARLHDDWWTVRQMGQKVNATHAALASAKQSLADCLSALDAAGICADFVEALRNFALRLQILHAALKDLEFDPLWP